MRQRITARLRELEPLVREYEELSRVAAEMGLAEERSAAPRGEVEPPTTARRGPRRAPAADGELTTLVLEAVRADPGKTVAEYAEHLGVAPTVLYRPIRRLTTEGALIKRARQLFVNR